MERNTHQGNPRLGKERTQNLGSNLLITKYGKKKNFEDFIEFFKTKTEIWSKRNHTLEGRATLLNIYAYPKLYHRAQNIKIPNETLKKIEQISFIWGDRLETIKREKLYIEKKSGGLFLHNPSLRQKAFFNRKLVELINDPEEDHNILLLSRIGPYPQLLNLLEKKPNISYRQVTNEKINYIRTQITACDQIIG